MTKYTIRFRLGLDGELLSGTQTIFAESDEEAHAKVWAYVCEVCRCGSLDQLEALCPDEGKPTATILRRDMVVG